MIATVAIMTALTWARAGAGAQALTKEELLKLYDAGFGEELIAEKIATDGIAFEVSADVMLELKNTGLSETLIGQLVRA